MQFNQQPSVKPEQKLRRIILVCSFVGVFLATVFFFAGNFLKSTETKASGGPQNYCLSGDCTSSSNQAVFSQAVSGDTLTVTGLFKIVEDCDELMTKNIILYIKGGEMRYTNDKAIYLGVSSKVFVTSSGSITNTGSCNSHPSIYFGSTKTVSCNGGNAQYSFADVNANGGVQSGSLTALPVKLIRFEAFLEGKEVLLKWATASEINNDRFEIERSTDGKDWSVVGTVKGNGNSNITNHYTYTDNLDMAYPNLVYRLHQIDFDGNNEYSPQQSITGVQSTKKSKVYPNPANERINVSLDAGAYQLSIVDQSGKTVLEKEVDNDFASIDSQNLPEGIYWVKMENNRISESQRVVVRH